MTPRSLWNGTLAFGEVAIPVKLFAATEDHRIHFREVRLRDGCRIEHRVVGADSGREIDRGKLLKAYETSRGRQVVLSDEEIAAARGSRPKVVEIEHFVADEQIDPVFYDKPYVVGAQDGGERAYRVLLAALERSERVGIGRFVLRTREQLVALRPQGARAAHDALRRRGRRPQGPESAGAAQRAVREGGRDGPAARRHAVDRVAAGELQRPLQRGRDGADRAQGEGGGDRAAAARAAGGAGRPRGRARGEPARGPPPARHGETDDAQKGAALMARGLWSGTLAFGLVAVPVELVSAVRDRDVHFHEVDARGQRVEVKRVCANDGKEVPWEQVGHGYELDGRLVVLSDEELAAAAPERTRTIEVEAFVPLADIDPAHFDHPYLLLPQGGAEGVVRAYRLLRDAMAETGQVAIGRIVMRSRRCCSRARFATRPTTRRSPPVAEPRREERRSTGR
jgi:non-homologous end joining protein Ku